MTKHRFRSTNRCLWEWVEFVRQFLVVTVAVAMISMNGVLSTQVSVLELRFSNICCTDIPHERGLDEGNFGNSVYSQGPRGACSSAFISRTEHFDFPERSDSDPLNS